MAALEKIRSLSGLLIAVVGIALLSFILGDFFSGRNSGPGDTNIAVVDGEAISYYDYQQRINNAVDNMKNQTGQQSLDEGTTNMIQNQVWDQMINGILMNKKLEDIGITVSSEELLDMVNGNNVHPEIQSIPLFQNPETGMFDPERVVQFLQNLDKDPSGENRRIWLSFEEYLVNQRKNDKYFSAVNKGIYITDSYSKQTAIEKAEKIDIKALTLLYSDIPDSTITVAEKDISDYYSKHKETYKQELTADIEYIVFPIEPTPSDINHTIAELEDIKSEFSAVQDNAPYVSANSDGAFDPKHYKKGEYPNTEIDSLMFALNVGEVYGPYLENEVYKISKLVRRENLPDTIQIVEITIVPTTNEEIPAKQAQADSLFNLVKEGTLITTLAQYSSDPTTVSAHWINTADMQYSEAVLLAKKGETMLEATATGYHIVQVVDRGEEVQKVQIATIERQITASEQTRSAVYQTANAFAATIRSAADFEQATLDKGYTKRLANKLLPTANEIRGLEGARPLIRETFFADEKSLIIQRNNNSPIFEMGSNYVIAILAKLNKEGYTPLADVKTSIEAAVIKEKKAAQLIANVNSNPTENLDELAEKVKGTVKEVKGLTFSAFSVPNMGVEPKINGIAMAMEKGKTSKPIEGNNGVYVIQVVEKYQAEEANLNIAVEKTNLQQQIKNRVASEIPAMLRKNAKIEDNRLTYQ